MAISSSQKENIGKIQKIKLSSVSILYLPNMALLDEDTGMMNGLGHARLEYKGLQAALQEVLHRQGKHIIKLVLALVQQTIAIHTSQKSFSLENAPSVLFVQCKQHAGIVPDAAECVLHSPELPLVAESILTNQLQLRIQPFLLEGPARFLESLPVVTIEADMHHSGDGGGRQARGAPTQAPD